MSWSIIFGNLPGPPPISCTPGTQALGFTSNSPASSGVSLAAAAGSQGVFGSTPVVFQIGNSTSVDGTTIPSAQAIFDNSVNQWTVVNGVVFENGVAAGFSANVILLLWFHGNIYQENAANQWFEWNGTSWPSVAGDPRLTVSASGSTIPSNAQLVDTLFNVWTVVSGVVYQNGVTAGYSLNVITLLWYNGVMYQENASDQWFSWNGTSWSTQLPGDPRIAASLQLVTTSPLATAVVNKPYSATITATGGTPPYTWSLV